MKATELRIGNLFTTFIPMTGSWMEKQRFDKEIYQCKICTFKDEETFKHFTGIPITKEWLLKFGFEKSSSHYVKWVNEHITFIIDVNESGFFLCDIVIDVKFHYVHQLQNLYFALTGEELTLNPIQ